MLQIFNTIEEYAELRKWLQSLKDRKKLSDWGDAMRWYIENDLFFLVSEVMRDGQSINLETGNRFYWDQFFVDWCRQVEYQISKGGGFDGSARGVGKSTIRTKGGNIQRLLKYPSSTGCIFSYQRRSSKKHFRSVKEELEENRILKTLFDDRLYWDPKAEARNGNIIWNNDDGLRMKGSTRKDMNLEYNAFFDGTPTGGRYDWMDFDDIEDHKAISSSDMLDKLHNTYDATVVLATPVVLNPPVVMFTNTFYSELGLANRVAKQFAAMDPLLARAIPGEDLSKPGNGPMGGTPVYPFTAQRLHWWHNQMRDHREYAIQICCSFLAGEHRTFQKDWFNYLPTEPEKWASGKNIYICVDPSKGVTDPMVIWVWALGADKKFAWVDASMKKLDPALPEFCEEIYMMLCKWQALGRRVVEIRVENFGQSTYDSMIEKYLRDRGNYTDVVPCHDNFRSGKFSSGKRDREFERWASPASEGRVLIPKPLSLGGTGLVRPDETRRNLRCLVDYFLDNEWAKFPKPLTDNMLDAGSLIWENEKRIGRVLQFPPSAYKAAAAERRSRGRRESAMSMG